MTSPNPPLVLGIETSCDETAVALVDGAGQVWGHRLRSQIEEHEPYGGVVPELAARAHLVHLPRLTRALLTETAIPPAAIDAIAATLGPGLIGGLLVGAGFGKALALAWGKPFLGINHLEAHALTARLPGLAAPPPGFPYLLLLVSGGHCLFVAVEGVGRHTVLGRGLDDAPGEVFDKVAKMLDLPWPGGPALEKLAKEGDATRFALPRPLQGRPGCDCSFAGLKTAAAQYLAQTAPAERTGRFAADLAASFEAAVAATLKERARNALSSFTAGWPDGKDFVVAGGVAANGTIRTALARAAAEAGLRFIAPPPALCTDNGVMVAWAGVERVQAGLSGNELASPPRPRWPLGLAAADEPGVGTAKEGRR
jgi:N6-L-threonylcarbamoyladenine synthase